MIRTWLAAFLCLCSGAFCPAVTGQTVWSTGLNNSGQLGLGDTVDRNRFTQAPGLASVTNVSGNLDGGCALKSDGTVWWPEQSARLFVQVPGLDSITAMAGDGYNGLFLRNDGTVWRDDGSGYAQVAGIGSVTAVAAGFGIWDRTYLAVKSDGTLWASGANLHGQLGMLDVAPRVLFAAVPGFTGGAAVSASEDHSLVVLRDGSVWACGNNDCGQLGMGDIVERHTFAQVPGLTNGVAVAAARGFSLVLRNDGTLWACGVNASGELGLGDNVSRNTFSRVPSLTNVVSVAVGGTFDCEDYCHSLALKADGTLWACGNNVSGQLGLGDNVSRNTFAQVMDVSNVIAIAAGSGYSYIVRSSTPVTVTTTTVQFPSTTTLHATSTTIAATTTTARTTTTTTGSVTTTTMLYHPADSNRSAAIAIGEMTAYGAAWKSGSSWPVGPVPVPISYITRAGYLWKNGETYHYDPTADPSIWPTNTTVWLPGAAGKPARAER